MADMRVGHGCTKSMRRTNRVIEFVGDTASFLSHGEICGKIRGCEDNHVFKRPCVDARSVRQSFHRDVTVEER